MVHKPLNPEMTDDNALRLSPRCLSTVVSHSDTYTASDFSAFFCLPGHHKCISLHPAPRCDCDYLALKTTRSSAGNDAPSSSQAFTTIQWSGLGAKQQAVNTAKMQSWKPVLAEPFVQTPLGYYFPRVYNCTATKCSWITCGTFQDEPWVCEGDPPPLVSADWITCTYPMSGSYSPVSRYVFYALAILAVFGRKRAWVVDVALISVMLFSATAAVHALVLGVAASADWANRLSDLRVNYEVVFMGGRSKDGRLAPGRGARTAPLWVPLIPMVYDRDVDAVLAITGFTYLCLVPMQIRSRTLQAVNGRRRCLLVAWIILVTFGLFGAFTAKVYLEIWYKWQVRFCPNDRRTFRENLPVFSKGPTEYLPSWDGHDWYRWNMTIASYFGSHGTNWTLGKPRDYCFYPCSDFWWPTRDPREIQLRHLKNTVYMSDNSDYFRSQPLPDSITAGIVYMACGALVLSLMLYGFHLSRSIRRSRHKSPAELGVRANWRALVRVFRKRPLRILKLISQTVVLLTTFLGVWVTTLGGLVLLGATEVYIWSVTGNWAEDEGFAHVEQWGILASTVFLFGGVLLTAGYNAMPTEPV